MAEAEHNQPQGQAIALVLLVLLKVAALGELGQQPVGCTLGHIEPCCRFAQLKAFRVTGVKLENIKSSVNL